MTHHNAGQHPLPLAGRTVVVLGAAGEVGEGLVRQLSHFGATVVAVSRSTERLARLQQMLARTIDSALVGTVSTQVGDAGDEDGAMRLRDALVANHGPFDGVVASLGGWRQGQFLTATPLADWREALEQSLTVHFLAASSLLPVIADREGASYTMINGGAALRAVPGAGAMCVSAAAQKMLSDALAAEHHRRAVRVNALLLNSVVQTRSRGTVSAGTISGDDVGAYAAYLASSLAVHIDGATVVLERPRGVQELPAPFGTARE